MAITTCPEPKCAAMISDFARVCPNCGCVIDAYYENLSVQSRMSEQERERAAAAEAREQARIRAQEEVLRRFPPGSEKGILIPLLTVMGILILIVASLILFAWAHGVKL